LWFPYLLKGVLSAFFQVKDRYISYAQLAEDWVSKSERILQMPFLDKSYATALEEAEQFLWGGHEMNSVCFFVCCDFLHVRKY
jgi:histone demethylase JARID1